MITLIFSTKTTCKTLLFRRDSDAHETLRKCCLLKVVTPLMLNASEDLALMFWRYVAKALVT